MDRGPLYIRTMKKHWVDTPGLWEDMATHCFGGGDGAASPKARRLERILEALYWK